MGFEIKYDSSTQKRRAINANAHNPKSIHVTKQTPEILRLLAETNLKTLEISKIVKVAQSSITNVARRNGVDLAERNKRIRKEEAKGCKPKSASAAIRTVMHETMTQDGVSLKWLSRQWKPDYTDANVDAGSM